MKRLLMLAIVAMLCASSGCGMMLYAVAASAEDVKQQEDGK